MLKTIGAGALATKYNIFASIANFAISYCTRVDGMAQTRWGATGMLVTDTMLTFGGIALMLGLAAALRPRRSTAASQHGKIFQRPRGPWGRSRRPRLVSPRRESADLPRISRSWGQSAPGIDPAQVSRMRNSTFTRKVMGSGLSLAAVLGAAVLWEGVASACSTPDTGTKAGKTYPFVTDSNPFYWDPNTQGPLLPNAGGGTTPAPNPGTTTDPQLDNHQALLFHFTAGDDRDSDPNRDYFNHAHRAYTLVKLTNTTTGAVVRTEKVPVWDYGAIDKGTAKKGDTFRRIEAIRFDALPAGNYTIQTQAVFHHPDGNDSNWGGHPLEGPIASTTFAIAQSPNPAPASTAVVGEGCQSTPTSPGQLGWLALGGIFLGFARSRRSRSLR